MSANIGTPSRQGHLFLLMAFIFFLVLVTVDGAVTTGTSRKLILSVRYLSLAGAGTCALLYARVCGLRGSRVFGAVLGLWGLALVWGGGLALLNHSQGVVWKSIAIGAFLGGLGAYLLHQLEPTEIAKALVVYFPVYALLTLLMTIAAGGLDLAYPPHFRFDYISGTKGGQVLYSQGASRLYGLASILSMCGAALFSGRMARLLYVLLAVLFLLFCLLGGARGESLFALVLVMGVALHAFGLRALAPVLLVALCAYILVDDWLWLDDFVVFRRYSVTLAETVGDGLAAGGIGIDADRKWGGRRVLLEQSLSLLRDVPTCLVTGCGFGYFQSYYGYPTGLYPHNEVIEAVIVYGLILSGLFLLTVYSGWRILLERDKFGWVLSAVFAYSFLLALKGGTLFADALFVAVSIYFSWLSVTESFWGRQWRKWSAAMWARV